MPLLFARSAPKHVWMQVPRHHRHSGKARLFDELAATLARGKTRRGKDKVAAEIEAITAKPWVRRVVAGSSTGSQPRDLRLTWCTDQHARAALEEEIFGKHVLITSHDDWPVPESSPGTGPVRGRILLPPDERHPRRVLLPMHHLDRAQHPRSRVHLRPRPDRRLSPVKKKLPSQPVKAPSPPMQQTVLKDSAKPAPVNNAEPISAPLQGNPQPSAARSAGPQIQGSASGTTTGGNAVNSGPVGEVAFGSASGPSFLAEGPAGISPSGAAFQQGG